ncbi:MAG: hypothetical protein ACLFV7_04845 [Phycisphaerae bacterium]
MKRFVRVALAATVLAGVGVAAMAEQGGTAALPQESLAKAAKLYGQIVDARDILAVSLQTLRTDAATRNAAASRGENRPGPATATYRLWLDDAADGDDVQMTLRYAGTSWRSAQAVVPAWAQSTMQEWRGYHHGNGAGCVWRFGVTHEIDTSKLHAGQDKLNGRALCTYRLDRTHDERFPPGEAVSWWDRFPGVGLSIPRRQAYDFDAEVSDSSHVLEMVLDGGIHWKPKKGKKKRRKQAEAIRKPIFLRLSLPATRLSPVWVQTPTWNGGFHEGDASGLTLRDGKLRGKLVVYIHGDGWVPTRGSHPPKKLVFEIDATLKHNQLDGKYTATGDMGDYDGSLTGTGGPAVVGSYRSSGDLDAAAGVFRGYVVDDPAPLKERLSQLKPLDDNPAAATRQIVGTLNTLAHEIRAMELAVEKFPLPLEEAMLQTACAEPVLGSANGEALLAYLERIAAAVVDAPANGRPDRTLTSADHPDSPSAGTVELQADQDGACTLPAKDDGQWYHLGQWQVAGPFGQRNGVEHNDALTQEVVCMPSLKLRQPTDRIGAGIENAPTVRWMAVKPGGARLRSPWGKASFYNRFRGELWYAAATVKSPRERTVWLAVEGLEQTKLWVNHRLVWSSRETAFRCRQRGRTMLPVKLRKGENHLLVRTNRDRRPAWVELAIRTAQPDTPRPDAPEGKLPDLPNPDVYPNAAPPLVWDIDRGVNVAWSNADLGGRSRPLVVGEAVFVSKAPGSLTRVNPADGKAMWTGHFGLRAYPDEAAALEGANRRAKAMDVREFKSLGAVGVTSPVSDGKTVYVHSELGRLGAFDKDKHLWTIETGLSKAKLHCIDGRVIVEGETTDLWKLPEALQTAAEKTPKKRFRTVGVLVVSDKGKVLHRYTTPGEFAGEASFLLAAATGENATVVLHTSPGMLYNVTESRPQGPFAIDYPGPNDAGWKSGGQIIGSRGGRAFRACVAGPTAFLATQEQTFAVRLWKSGDDLAHAHKWESNYEHSGHGSFTAPCVATRKYLFSVWPVLERGPHCPDPRIEIHVQDAQTGRPLGRLKPALENVVQTCPAPVIAGKYLFTTGPGGGSHGGHPTHSQIVVTTADEQLQLVSRNLVPKGARAPVFAGSRMFIRYGGGLVCVEVDGKDGRAHQQKVLADTVLGEIGARPIIGDPREIGPLANPMNGPRVPVGKLRDARATDKWLAAGPFAKGLFDADQIGLLSPVAGEKVTLEGQSEELEIVSRQYAAVNPPRFAAQYSLQGTGENVPVLSTSVDPRVVSGRDRGTGLLLTVLDNREQNVVIPALKAKGVRQFLSGRELKADEPLLLAPGQYPFAVVVTPEYYHVEQEKVYPPIDVLKASEKKLLNTSVWPDTWKVVGPLPPETKPLSAEELKKIPEKVTVGDREFAVHDFQPVDGVVYLTALLDLREGQKPDWKNAPKTMKIGTPSNAYAMAEIDVPEDGMLYVTAGADWFMRWTLDGKVVYDRLKSGNAAAPTEIKAHPFAIPVTKGKHVLAVQVKPGSRGWSFTAAGGFVAEDSDEIKALRVPSRIKPAEPDFEFAPAFKIVPHPMRRQRLWQDRIAARRERLQAVIDGLPGSNEAKAATALLEILKKERK